LWVKAPISTCNLSLQNYKKRNGFPVRAQVFKKYPKRGERRYLQNKKNHACVNYQ